MKKLWELIGVVIFFLGWPVWFVYFKIFHHRTRILITSSNHILLVRGWLSNNAWSLPGGGLKSSEKANLAAVRELQEETNVIVAPEQLKQVDSFSSSQYLLKYNLIVFRADIKSRPNPKPSFPEILDSRWVNTNELSKYKLGAETSQIINNHLL